MHKKPIRSFDDLANPLHPGPARGIAPHLRPDRRARQRRSHRPDGRAVLRDPAAGLRLQRHRVPHLHPDGVAPAQERSLHRQGFHRRRLYQRRHRLGERQQPGQHDPASFPAAWPGALRCRATASSRGTTWHRSAGCGSRAVAHLRSDRPRAGERRCRRGLRRRRRECRRHDDRARNIRRRSIRSSPGTSRRAAFAACGYAMFTNKLGVCWATAGPGAFNLFSGLAVAMSDSYPLLAISGYASLELARQGLAQRDVGRQPDAGFAGDVRRHHQEKLAADRCRRHDGRARRGGEPRLRGAARPGAHPRPGKPHAPRRRGDQLPRPPSCGEAGPARSGARRRDRRLSRRCLRQGQEGRGAGRLRRDPQRCRRRRCGG